MTFSSVSSTQNEQLSSNRVRDLAELEANNASLISQLNEARIKLSEVEKRNKLLSGDHDALSNISLEQCDELILTLNSSQEKLQQRRVSNEPYLYTIIAYSKRLTQFICITPLNGAIIQSYCNYRLLLNTELLNVYLDLKMYIIFL